MKTDNRIKGSVGESIAADFLSSKGYKILEKNFQTKFGEIDLICTKGECLIFVEVKMKGSDDFGAPHEMISKNKVAQVMRMGEFYRLTNQKLVNFFPEVRVDAVTILAGDAEPEVNHYENISADFF